MWSDTTRGVRALAALMNATLLYEYPARLWTKMFWMHPLQVGAIGLVSPGY